MVSLLIIGLLVASIPLFRSQLKAAVCLDLVIVALLIGFRVLPGTAYLFDWVLAGFFLLDGSVFFLAGRRVLI